VIGESPLTWGEWRNIPAVGEDHLYLLWRWNDCCATF
jgi:conjugal transfer pilus assembly protein TraU